MNPTLPRVLFLFFFFFNIRILNPGMREEWREEGSDQWAHKCTEGSNDAALTQKLLLENR